MERRSFLGSKLRLARLFHAFTQTELSAMVGCTQSMIAHAEAGKEPSRDVIEAVSHVLHLSPDFFFEPLAEEFRDNECNFRKRKSTTQQTRSVFLSHGTLFGSFLRHLETEFDLPNVTIPEIRVESDEDVERAAARCRMTWGLGLDRPVSSTIRLVENIGCVATRFRSNRNTVDAFSRYGARPIVVLNSDKVSSTKVRHDVAHELGHLVMHRGVVTGLDDQDETEQQAERFAGLFLVPKASFMRDFPRTTRVDWNAVYALKQRWGVNAKSIIYRAQQYELIGADEARRAYKHYNYMGWHKAEPHEPLMEDPELVKMAVDTICSEDGIGVDAFITKTAAVLKWKPMMLYNVLGRKPGAPPPSEPDSVGTVVNLGDWRKSSANDG